MKSPKANTRAKTFVLVHGAWHGGWCWKTVADDLRGRGHAVFTPTQTGLGDRAHLMSKSITLDTFVTDIAKVIEFEELSDVVLVGHSFGGMTITGVADRMRERLSRLVYIDSLMLESGQKPFDLLPPELVAARIKQAESSGGLSIPPPPVASFGVTDKAQSAWLERRLTPHPLSTYQSPLILANKVGNGLPMTYIPCVEPLYRPAMRSHDLASAWGMTIAKIATGHDAMVSAPALLADMLDAD